MATLLRRQETLQCEIEFLTERLLEKGYVIIPGVVDPAILAAIDADFADAFIKTPFCEGRFYGDRTVRFGRALTRSPHCAALVQNELVLGIVNRSLQPWCETVQLNLTQAIAVHPGAPAQLPHRDQDMWVEAPKGEIEYTINVIWPLTRFNRENGATAVWGYSHRQDKDKYVADDDTIAAEMEVGSVLLFLGSTLHGQGENSSDEVRRALVVGYSLSWLKAFENQFLSYPPEVARHFPADLAELVGYRHVRPNLNSYEGQSPAILLQDSVPEHPGAIDAFRPDQVEAINYYYAHRRPRLV